MTIRQTATYKPLRKKPKKLRKTDLTKTQSASEGSVEFVSVFGRFTNGKNKYYLVISELN